MSTPTLRELVAKATPGPWKARRLSPDDAGFVQADEPTKRYGTEILGEDYFPHRSRAADVDYIARLSPEVVLAVYEALQLASLNYERTNHSQPDLMGDDEHEAWTSVRKSLNALDGITK